MSWFFQPLAPSAATLSAANSVPVSTAAFTVDWSINHTVVIGSPTFINVDTAAFTVTPQTLTTNPAHVGMTTFTTAVTQYTSGTAWTNAANARVNDGSYATVTLGFLSSSNILQYRLSDLGLPGNAYVRDICVRVYTRVSATASQNISCNIVDRASGGNLQYGAFNTGYTSANTWELKTFGTTTEDGDVWSLDSGRLSSDFWNASTSFLEVFTSNGSASSRTHDIDYVEILVSYDTANKVRVDTTAFDWVGGSSLVYGFVGEVYSVADTAIANNTWGWTLNGTSWSNISNAFTRLDNPTTPDVASTTLSSTMSYTLGKTFGELGIPTDATLLSLEVSYLAKASSTSVWPYMGLYWKGDGSAGYTSQGDSGMPSGSAWKANTLGYTPSASQAWNSAGYVGLFFQGTGTVDVEWLQIYVQYACAGNVIQVTTTDFVMGRGTQTASAWTNPTVATNVNWGNPINWVNKDNVLTQDDTSTSATMSGGAWSNDLCVTGFGLAVPSGATVEGVDYRIDAYGPAATARLSSAVYTRNDGTYGSQDLAGSWGTTMSDYGTSDTDNNLRFYNNTRDVRRWLDTAQFTCAQRGTLFGHRYWDDVNNVYKQYTVADINSSDFGVSAWVYDNVTADPVYIDNIQVQVKYTTGDITITNGGAPPPPTLYTFMLLGYGL